MRESITELHNYSFLIIKWQNFINKFGLRRQLPIVAALVQAEPQVGATGQLQSKGGMLQLAINCNTPCFTLVLWPLLGKFAKNVKNSQPCPTNRFCDK